MQFNDISATSAASNSLHAQGGSVLLSSATSISVGNIDTSAGDISFTAPLQQSSPGNIFLVAQNAMLSVSCCLNFRDSRFLEEFLQVNAPTSAT